MQGFTALHIAAGNVCSNLAIMGMSVPLTGVPSVKIVAELIQRGADVKGADREVCPFHYCVVTPPKKTKVLVVGRDAEAQMSMQTSP